MSDGTATIRDGAVPLTGDASRQLGRQGSLERHWSVIRPTILIIYAALVSVALYRHAMWRDEMQAWLIARDSASLTDLMSNLRYEGHPALWYVLLWPLAHLSADPTLMQGLHGAIAVSTVAVVLWFAPFSPLEKALFPFGYFTLFEYAVKSRSYGLGFLIIAVICAAWPYRRSHPLRLALLLALLANVHALFMLVSAALLAALGLDRLRPSAPALDRITWRTDAIAVTIVLAGWAAAFATAHQPADSGFAEGWFLHLSKARLLLSLGLRPLSATAALLALTLPVAAVGLLRWRRDPLTAVFLCLAFGFVFYFFYGKYPGAAWHHGVFFVVIVAVAWLSGSRGTALVPRSIMVLLLAAQAVAGLHAVRRDLGHPLSAGRAVARYLDANGLAAGPIVGVPDVSTVTIVGYLGLPRAFYPYGNETAAVREGGRWGSFVIFDRLRLAEPDDAAILAAADRLGPSTTILMPLARDATALQARGFTLMARFPDATVADETFALYRKRKGSELDNTQP